jgi:hypothetical protein
MFKVNNINGDYFDTATKAVSVLGSALHRAMEVYLGGTDQAVDIDDAKALLQGYDGGTKYLENFTQGLIEWNDRIPNETKMLERYAFAYYEYQKKFNYKSEVKEVLGVEKELLYTVSVGDKLLPIPLKGKIDFFYRDMQGRIKIRDYKFTGAFSPEKKIDAKKIIQAVFYYFLVFAHTGEAPYSCQFDEVKTTENRDKTADQVKQYEFIYAQEPLMFDLFYRLYDDITKALMGHQVYIPNFEAFYDNEVAVLAYIHGLDIDEVREQKFKEMKVKNITDFLKKKLQSSSNMKKYIDVVNTKFISATTLNYKDMTTPDRIRAKLAEHGIALDFVDSIVGSAVTLYRFDPSIGIKMTKLATFSKDIEQATETSDVRILAPIPDSGLVGFEVPNKVRTFPGSSNLTPDSKGLELLIGIDVLGQTIGLDLKEAPHMLVAGSSGSGKSVQLNNIIKQLIVKPMVELHLFDPKKVELKQYKSVVKEYRSNHSEITESLMNLVEEMNKRYDIMEKANVRDISETQDMKYKVIVIDEYADLAMKSETNNIIQMLAQMGRACGIHLIIATQRASTKVISGDVKVNFPTKLVFKMAKGVDSRVMLDEEGAEKLLGKGDMLAQLPGKNGLVRLQGFSN